MGVSDKWDGLVRARTIQELVCRMQAFRSRGLLHSVCTKASVTSHVCACYSSDLGNVLSTSYKRKGYTASFVLIKTEGFSPSCQLTRDKPKLSGDFQPPRPGDPFFLWVF